MSPEEKRSKILSCGVVPLKKQGDQWLYLLLRCYRYWDFPKGHKEEGEDPLIAALRELVEETGITRVKKTWGDIYRETEIYSNSKIARYYLAEVDAGEDIKLIPNPLTGIIEHHEFRWLPYEEARLLLVPRVQKIIDWANEQVSSK